jgi:hypothetical protein
MFWSWPPFVDLAAWYPASWASCAKLIKVVAGFLLMKLWRARGNRREGEEHWSDRLWRPTAAPVCVWGRDACIEHLSWIPLDLIYPYLTYSNFIILHLHVLICAAGHCQKPWWILASKKKAGFHCKHVPCHYVRLWSCCQCRLCIQSDLYEPILCCEFSSERHCCRTEQYNAFARGIKARTPAENQESMWVQIRTRPASKSIQ